MRRKWNICVFVVVLFEVFVSINALPDEGKWNYNLTAESASLELSKILFKNARICITVNCETLIHDSDININLVIKPSPCLDVSDTMNEAKKFLEQNRPACANVVSEGYCLKNNYKCENHIFLDDIHTKPINDSLHCTKPIHIVPHDGVYLLLFNVQSLNKTQFNIDVHIEMYSDYGYLSAADWPLLPFYGIMCIFYVILGLIWLLMSFLQWRDLLRIQFWIGGVILLGMLEKATFYAEYQSINNTGIRVQGAMLFAEWISCGKRTLARMLVIIVSFGFGIVKPRLGSTLHRVAGVGLLYFFLAASEAYLRIMKSKSDQGRDLQVATVPLAVLDSGICWWIFSALVNTTRTLRLRRNEVKLALYRHFTNTLIFAVIASICFMLYSIKTHWVDCVVVWKDLWLKEAYWHILFSAMLLVIMILWRPTNNNQRYAFVSLLDNADDEEEEQLVNDAYGVKVRIHHAKQVPSSPKRGNSVEDDFKWLEENIKSDPALPILDSDEELVNTRFEVSKMQ